MIPNPIKDISRLCLHTITTKPWSIEDVIIEYRSLDIRGVTVWRQALQGRHTVQTGRQIRDAGLSVVSLCRAGFFPAAEKKARLLAVDENLRAIDEAAELGAPLLVLVCGSDPGQSLETSRQQIIEGLHAVLPHAAASGIKLGVEPLHPMYADTRSAINSMRQANEICEQLDSDFLGVIVDVYHLWWDPDLREQIQRCGENENIFAFHISDWKVPTQDFLNDRGLMGEGCIPLQEIRAMVEQAGFDGWIEVEIFSYIYWAQDQSKFLNQIIQSYLENA